MGGTAKDLVKTKKLYKDWKSKLSGAFDDKQIFVSLIVLGIFYIVYTLVNGFFDTDNKDEDNVINCTCKTSHRVFYISWFSICSVIWLVLHSILFYQLVITIKTVQGKDKKKNKPEKKVENITLITVLEQCTEIVWYQYYKLFVVGYYNAGEAINLAKIEKDLEKRNRKNNDVAEEEEEAGNEMTQDDPKPLELTDMTDCISFYYKVKRNPSLLSNGLLKIFLTLTKYIAQLATVPLLTLQMFDTYALLCFGASDYCSSTSKYEFHTIQVAITFAFYCSLGLSLLTSTMLLWNPWPKPEKQTENSQGSHINANANL